MILSKLLVFLREIGASPKKSLSQNFLIDPNIVQKIIKAAKIQPKDVVLEIGPGPGALTSALLDAGAEVHAIEKDSRFAKALSRLQTPDQRLKVYLADALEYPLDEIPAKKVVANLPFHITTPLLEKLFMHRFSSLTLMLQKEFAHRLLAKCGTKDFSSFTLFAQFHATIKGSFSVSSSCFYPKPNVDSMIVSLASQPQPFDSPKPFFDFVRRAFQQRRKMIASSLQEFFSAEQIKSGLSAIGVRMDARPEMLSLDQWILLFIEVIGKKS